MFRYEPLASPLGKHHEPFDILEFLLVGRVLQDHPDVCWMLVSSDEHAVSILGLGHVWSVPMEPFKRCFKRIKT